MFKRNNPWALASVLPMVMLLVVGSGANTSAQINQPGQPGQPVPQGWQVISGLLPNNVALDSVYIPRTVDTPAGAWVAGYDSAAHGVVYQLTQRGFGGPWSSQLDQSFPSPVRALYWINGQNIWVVGDGGLLANRDATGWHQISSPVANANLSAIQMFGGGDEGWAAGSVLGPNNQMQPVLLHYKSGQWQEDNSITSNGSITSLSFDPTLASGWLVGTVGIWQYQSGKWSNETAPAPPCANSCTADLTAVRAISSDGAWAVGSSVPCATCMLELYAIHRSNGNWQAILPATAIAGTNPVTDNYTAAQLNAVTFPSAGFGLAVGYNTHSITRTSPSRPTPIILRYQDGGWNYEPLPINLGLLNAVYAVAPGYALAVGGSGLILSEGYGNSTDSGSNPASRVPDPHDPNVTYFNQTGHTLRGTFRDYWQAKGGLAQFGYPITEQFSEVSATDGKSYTVQYFERNRFEYHPENQPPNNVLLGLLGRTVTAGREGEPPFQRTAAMLNPSAIYFDQTGHNLSGVFRVYWQAHGGLAIYGYPISEAFSEVSKTDGKSYTVQYFERNRFEYHPELPADYQVSLGLLGVQVLQQRGWLP